MAPSERLWWVDLLGNLIGPDRADIVMEPIYVP